MIACKAASFAYEPTASSSAHRISQIAIVWASESFHLEIDLPSDTHILLFETFYPVIDQPQVLPFESFHSLIDRAIKAVLKKNWFSIVNLILHFTNIVLQVVSEHAGDGH